jgi:hypothetical protein
MDKSISLIAGIKEAGGNGTNVLRQRQQPDYDASLKKFKMPCIVMIELLQN